MKIRKGDIVEWKWESPDVLMRLSYKVEQVENHFSTKKVGFSSGNASTRGSYVFQFNKPGIFHYWSGYVNFKNISFRGTIQVQDSSDKLLDIEVLTNGYKGFLIHLD